MVFPVFLALPWLFSNTNMANRDGLLHEGILLLCLSVSSFLLLLAKDTHRAFMPVSRSVLLTRVLWKHSEEECGILYAKIDSLECPTWHSN